MSIYFQLYIVLSFYLSIYLSTCLSIYQSISLSIYSLLLGPWLCFTRQSAPCGRLRKPQMTPGHGVAVPGFGSCLDHSVGFADAGLEGACGIRVANRIKKTKRKRTIGKVFIFTVCIFVFCSCLRLNLELTLVSCCWHDIWKHKEFSQV